MTLLLNLGSTGGANAGSSSMGAICAQYASTAGNATKTCSDVSSGAGQSAYMWNNTTKQCWICGGTYSACTATKDPLNATVPGNCCLNPPGCTLNDADPVQAYVQIN
ncbi:MAG TPA: hypothetical protein VJH23_00665 [archaeon]|nr:hypothetical protein [archaeon]